MAMPHGSVHVFTFKEGLLARAAHDLRLTVERFEVKVEADRLVATFETGSLRVDGAMREGTLAAGELSAGDRLEIEGVIRNRILVVDKYPEARLEARVERLGSRAELQGELELLGQRRGVTFEAERVDEAGGDWLAKVELVPSRWGIRPYTAMLGALRLADRVRVVAALRIE